MNLDETLANHSKLDLPSRGVERGYSEFRRRTERDFGNTIADSVEEAVAALFESIIQKIAGRFSRDDVVETFQSRGWCIEGEKHLTQRLDQYHDFASVDQRGSLAGHSQFEGAFSLKSLNKKYFSQTDDRTTTLTSSNLPGAILAVSELGGPPRPEYAFGLKAVLPHQADYLLWWATKESSLWAYFAKPTDLGTRSWAVLEPSSSIDRLRPFSKGALGKADFRLGPSNREERFYWAAFTTPEADQEIELRQGCYLAYHVV